MDKLHVVVMWRNSQTRYTACSMAAVFTRQWLPRGFYIATGCSVQWALETVALLMVTALIGQVAAH